MENINKKEVVQSKLKLVYCRTPVLGLALGVDFTFTWDKNKNNNKNNSKNNKNPHLNFLKRTVKTVQIKFFVHFLFRQHAASIYGFVRYATLRFVCVSR